MNCPSCGKDIQIKQGFCSYCNALVSGENVLQKHDTKEISKYRDTIILPKAENAESGKYPQVNALCAGWRVCTRDAFGSDVNGYVSSLTKPALAVMTAVIAGEDRPVAVSGYLEGNTPIWHDQILNDHSSIEWNESGTKDYLKKIVQVGGQKSGILTRDYEVRNSIGPLLKCFLPALIVSYDVNLSGAYNNHEHIVGNYDYDRLDKLPPY